MGVLNPFKFLRRLLTIIGAAFVAVAVISCGHDICIAGLGSCDHIWAKHAERQKQNPPATIAFGPERPSVSVGGSVKFHVSGGQPPYTYVVLLPATGGGNFSTDGTYHAPDSVPSNNYQITARVTDKNNNSAKAVLVVRSN